MSEPQPAPAIPPQSLEVSPFDKSDTINPAVPIRARRKKSMSRRIGQNGTIEVRDGAYRGRWLEDVPGQVQRVKRSAVLGFVKEMTKSEARRKLRSIIEATGINSPHYVIPATDIFAKRVKWWEENYLSRQKPSTQKTMSYHVRKYLLPKWEKYPVDEITAGRVNEWIGEPELQHLSPTSLKHLVTTLCLILGKWFGRKKINYPAIVSEEREPVCYTPEQMSQIIAEAQGMWKVLFATAVETGARAGELYALEVKDIDFARNLIHVRRAVWEGQKQSTKTHNASRAIDVQPTLIAMLKDYLNGRTEGLVFPSKNGKPLRNNNVLRRRLHPLLRKLGIPEGGMHGFRHGRVSFLVENNSPVEVIKAWVGHGSERMVRRYTHLRPLYRSRVLASIPSLVGNKIDVFDPLTPIFQEEKVA
jgi:integrase